MSQDANLVELEQQHHALEREIEEEIAREIARLRRRAKDRLLSKLNASQREKVDELFGDVFEFTQRKKKLVKKDEKKSAAKTLKK